MNQYFRITAYHPAEDLSVIFDTNGLYEKLWQFSSFLVCKGFEVIEVSNADRFLDGNITRAEQDKTSLILRAHKTGRPETTTFEHKDINYRAVRVADKIYIPDRDKRV